MSNTRTYSENNAPSDHPDEPLLRLLIAEATRKGDTLQSLSSQLGITYTRLTQWRRKQSQMKNAHRSVHIQAAKYLELPPVIVLILAGVVSLPDFIYPGREPLQFRLLREFDAMRQDPLFAGFFPSELTSTSETVQVFVAFMYSELRARNAEQAGRPWLSMLEEARARSQEILHTGAGRATPHNSSKGIF